MCWAFRLKAATQDGVFSELLRVGDNDIIISQEGRRTAKYAIGYTSDCFIRCSSIWNSPQFAFSLEIRQ